MDLISAHWVMFNGGFMTRHQTLGAIAIACTIFGGVVSGCADTARMTGSARDEVRESLATLQPGTARQTVWEYQAGGRLVLRSAVKSMIGSSPQSTPRGQSPQALQVSADDAGRIRASVGGIGLLQALARGAKKGTRVRLELPGAEELLASSIGRHGLKVAQTVDDHGVRYTTALVEQAGATRAIRTEVARQIGTDFVPIRVQTAVLDSTGTATAIVVSEFSWGTGISMGTLQFKGHRLGAVAADIIASVVLPETLEAATLRACESESTNLDVKTAEWIFALGALVSLQQSCSFAPEVCAFLIDGANAAVSYADLELAVALNTYNNCMNRIRMQPMGSVWINNELCTTYYIFYTNDGGDTWRFREDTVSCVGRDYEL
ncbi:MAG: hypothetical protein K2R93_15990 [Gemmatimonadaceae bacterium]|nr:hypothetical protein [Gemmatimonadaceae bacterium]